MNSKLLRDAAKELTKAADHVDGPAPNVSFNWGGLVQLLVQIIPAIIALFTSTPTPTPTPTPAPTPPPTPVA
jgi:hypothetical protein